LLNYEIVSTGSKGNCVVIQTVMIDCGVPFKRIKDYLYDVQVLLLTHVHSDHIKESTLKNIVMMFPHIKIFGNYEVVQVFAEYPIQVINAGMPFEAKGITFTPFECVHDVVCYGYIWNYNDQSIIYATDTSNLNHAPEGKYDYLFLESNHDLNKLQQIDERKYGYNVISGAKRHLSTQSCKAFYYLHRRDKESKLIQLHMSSRFY
jgi:Cft2 family RNA processing exonuclease